MQKRILITTGIFPPDIGGPATFVPTLAKFLSDRSYLCRIITLGSKNSKFFLGKVFVRVVTRRINRIVRLFVVLPIIARNLKNSDILIAAGLYEEASIANLLFKRISVAKIVGDPIWERYRNKTGSAVTIEEFNANKLERQLKMERKLLVWALNRYAKITCPSAQLRDLMVSWGVKRPIVVIQNGIICTNKEILTKKYDVISTSRLVNWKNVDLLIDSCVRLNLKLAICGIGPELDQLKKLASLIDHNNLVSFLGDLDKESIQLALLESKVFALISHYEGLSYGLIEAMHLGLTIVVSEAKGNAEVIKNQVNGLVVPFKFGKELDDALSKAVKIQFPLGILGKNAMISARENFCQEKQLLKLIDFLDIC